jgi:hypothetical protein
LLSGLGDAANCIGIAVNGGACDLSVLPLLTCVLCASDFVAEEQRPSGNHATGKARGTRSVSVGLRDVYARWELASMRTAAMAERVFAQPARCGTTTRSRSDHVQSARLRATRSRDASARDATGRNHRMRAIGAAHRRRGLRRRAA